MSNNNHSADNQKKTPKETKQQKVVRLVCLFLALLMILSCVSVLAYVFGSSWNVAADTAYAYPNDLIAVGLECTASEVTVGFELSTTNGFVVNKTIISKTVRETTPIYEIGYSDVFVVVDDSLDKTSSGGYKEHTTTELSSIGGFHLQIDSKNVDVNGVSVPSPLEIQTQADMKALVSQIDNKLSGTKYRVIPSYIDDKYVIRIGDFSTADRVDSAKESVSELLSEYNLITVQPSATGVSVVEPNLNQVLFEYDCGGGAFSTLGLSPIDNGELMKTYQSRLYGGTMCYKRGNDGIQVTSLIDFEEYIKCVVPWEISSSWNYNALCAFAIAVRTYAIDKKNQRMTKYGIDVYDDSYDQVYGGYTKVTEKVERAVKETEGKVVFFKGKPAELYYSSSTGGYTVSNKSVWGGTALSYLNTKATPWENYADLKKGLWTVEVTGTELYNSLKDLSSCSNLKKPIKTVTVNSTAGESGYVTSITFTDTAGNSATVGSTTTKVKSAMSDFCYSANFVVGKGSVDYSYNVINNIYVGDNIPPDEMQFIEKNPTFFDKFLLSSYNAISSLKKVLGAKESALSMITSSGRKNVTISSANVLTAENYKKLIAAGYDIDNIYEYDEPLDPNSKYTSSQNESNVTVQTSQTNEQGTATVVVDYNVVQKTATASKSDSFVFVGKGWGHGVGMSQYGVLHLANAGVSGDDILEIYFPGTTIDEY